jgi:hypothetical protein
LCHKRLSRPTRRADAALSEDAEQKYLFVADGTNNQIHILLRATGERLASFGRGSRQAGQFRWVRAIGLDSQGDFYAGEVDSGKRAQKSRRVREQKPSGEEPCRTAKAPPD